MIPALLAAALAALPSFDVQLSMSLRGERVGAVHLRSDGARFRYESTTVVRRGSELSTEHFSKVTKLGGALPSTLALWLFHDGVSTCFDVVDEREGKRGKVCGRREGRTLSGTLLGEPFTALLDGDGGPDTLELPNQGAHFERVAGELPLPVPRDLFRGSTVVDALKNLEASDRVRVRASSSECRVDEVLERAAPKIDEPLSATRVASHDWATRAAELELGTRTRWATAVALAKFVDQAIASVPASSADEQAQDVWAARRGSCLGQARVFEALASSSGVPARVVYGALVEDGRVAPHAWDEVEVGGRWYGVDPSRGAAPVGPEHIPLAREGDPDPLRAGRCLLALPSMSWDAEAR